MEDLVVLVNPVVIVVLVLLVFPAVSAHQEIHTLVSKYDRSSQLVQNWAVVS